MTLLRMHGVVKRFGGLAAVDDCNLEVHEGELHALIGPNGAGKTTLINLLAGELSADGGHIELGGCDITALSTSERALRGIGRSFQISTLFSELSVLENVMLAVQARAGHSFGFLRPVISDEELVAPARAVLRECRIRRPERTPVQELAHGERRQVELAMVVAMSPRLIVLDEPMAGMSRRESDEMVELIRDLKGKYSIILVEHDMDAVFALADRISVLVYGRVIAMGAPGEIRMNLDVRTAYLGDSEVST